MPEGKKRKMGDDGRQECSTEYDQNETEKVSREVGEHFSVVASERQPRCAMLCRPRHRSASGTPR